MTEDRLTHLLTEATDLRPSEALRDRVADLRPSPRRTPWFALSGATAALAVAAFVAIPRPVSAAERLRRAGEALKTATSYRATQWAFRKGWVLFGTTEVTPGWIVSRTAQGRVYQLKTPDGYYRPRNRDTRLFFTHDPYPWQHTISPDPNLAAGLESFNGWGDRTTPEYGRTWQEDGERLHEVILTDGVGQYRRRYVFSDRSVLPLRTVEDRYFGRAWHETIRDDFAFPVLTPNSPTFRDALKGVVVVDQDALAKRWAKRLAPTLRTLRTPNGKVLEVRDLRRLPSGDVVMLYTGTPKLKARLVGEDGTAFVRCPFLPDEASVSVWNAPPILPEGKTLYGLWFAPKGKGAAVKGSVRLELFDSLASRIGAFRIRPEIEPRLVPEWADALTFVMLSNAASAAHWADVSRVVAAYDHWRDARGRSVSGPFSLDPKPGSLEDYGVRNSVGPRDPRGVAEAIRLQRAMLRESFVHADPNLLRRGWNPIAEDPWLAAMEAEKARLEGRRGHEDTLPATVSVPPGK